MCSEETCLGYALLVTLLGFTILIFACLKYRKKILNQNLTLRADQVWEKVSQRAEKLKLDRSQLNFGIWQDSGFATAALVVKDQQSRIVGRVEKKIRGWTVKAGDESYRVEFPLTAKRTAVLFKMSDDSKVAAYTSLNFFGKHSFEIPGYGSLASERSSFSFYHVVNYRTGEKLVGTTQNISSRKQTGRIALLPTDIPLHVRIFILAMV